MSALKLKGVRKSFGSVEVLKGIDLEIAEGEFMVFVGPSGCGKSTLLRIIAGLEEATSGAVEIAGRPVERTPPAKRGIAMVFQSYALYPHLSVRGNMALGLKQIRTPRAEIERRIARAARMLGLEDYLDRHPAELSGGQRQRVAIGRAIVREPKLFLFDEPLSNLDAALRVNTRLEIARLHRALKAAMVYVTHDQVEAMTLADRIAVIEGGVIRQVGAPMELYDNPRDTFVAGFIGSPKMNLFDADRAGMADAHTVGVRPEHLDLSPEAGLWKARVIHVERLGADAIVYLEAPETGRLTARAPGACPWAPDDILYVTPQRGRVHRFDAEGRIIPPQSA